MILYTETVGPRVVLWRHDFTVRDGSAPQEGDPSRMGDERGSAMEVVVTVTLGIQAKSLALVAFSPLQL